MIQLNKPKISTQSTNVSKPTKPIKRKKKGGKGWIIALSVTLILAVFAAIAVYLVIMLAGEKMLKENVSRLTMDQATIIYDKDGNELTSVYRQNRELVNYNEIPEQLKDAFIAVEDKRFFEHTGFDVRAVTRAIYRDIVQRSAKEGGSTITQQLAKNMFLSSDKTLFRKVRELSLSLALENNYTKDEIIEMYLNNIYFGNGTYGVKTASKLFFNKSDLNDLELWQMATLAAIPKAPTKYSPLNDPEASKFRRAVVLLLMKEQGYISEQERLEARDVEYVAEDYQVVKQDAYTSFIDFAVNEVTEVYGISEEELLRSGYKIYTTLDQQAQRAMDEVFRDTSHFPPDGPEQVAQGAMVILDQYTGSIIAMNGGRNYVNKGLNRVLVKRQPGSSFKPIVSYAPALEAGRNPYESIPDEKRSFGNYSPKNYDNVYRGKVDMFEAIRLSINLPAVNILNEYGVDGGYNFAKKLGFSLSEEDRNLSIALGGLTYGVTPLEMARAYAAFANNGEMIESHAILKVIDSYGDEVKSVTTGKKRELSSRQVMSSATAYHMTQMLQRVVTSGTGKGASIPKRPVAGKTGTTQSNVPGVSGGNRDAWFVGYTPEYTAAVWVGFDKTDREHYLVRSSGVSAELFSSVMSKVLRDTPASSFRPPSGVYDIEKYKKPKASVNLRGTSSDEGSIQLQWKSSESNLNYRIYRKDQGSDDFSIIDETMELSYVDYDIIPGEYYSYYIEVVRPETTVAGEQSNVVEVATPIASELEDDSSITDDNPIPDETQPDDPPFDEQPAEEQPTDEQPNSNEENPQDINDLLPSP